MASYYAKYYYQTERNGNKYTLIIYQRSDTGIGIARRDIMNLVDLRFGTSGSVEIDEPIIKTELSFTLVDCPDVQYGPLAKGANWQEFYTQDPTLYKVELSENNAFRWSGYITPDSWTEELRYHGTVTITARDCIGHLQDFDFEWEEETITLAQIISKCNALAGTNIITGDYLQIYGVRYTKYDGETATDPLYLARFYKEAFEDKNWYEVLEMVLESLSLTLRYFDNNIFGITPLAFIRTEAFNEAFSSRISIFAMVNNSGSHALAPPYRFIRDKISYDFFDSSSRDIPKSSFQKNAAYDSPLTTAAGYQKYKELNAADVLLFRFDLTDNSYVQTQIKISASTKFVVNLELIGGHFFKNLQYGGMRASLSFTPAAVTARFSILWVGDDGTTKIYQNPSAWSTTSKILTYTSESSDAAGYSSFAINGTTPNNKGKLYLRFYHASGASGYGERRFTAVKGIGVDYTLSAKTTKHEQTTVNNDLANIRLDRTDDVGQYVGDPSVGLCVKNAILAGTSSIYYSIDGINKDGDTGERARYPNMWVWTHKQRLCFHWNTASIIEGELYDKTNNDPKFSDIWLYPFSSGQKRLHLVSGQLNVLTGRVEGAVLREFWDFNSLWQEPKMNYYQFYLVSAESATGYDEIVAGQNSDGYYISSRLGSEDYPVTVHCRLANAMGWDQPAVDMSVYHSHAILRSERVLSLGDTQEVSEFDIVLTEQDFTDQEPEVFIQALWRKGDEGGEWWEEAPTLNGHIHLKEN